MSEKTAIRTWVTLAVAAACWLVAGWWLSRTTVPDLHLSGLDEHLYFTPQEIRRSSRFARGEDLLWLAGTLATLAALAFLAWRLPRSVPQMGLGRIGSAIIVGMVLLTTLWAVSLPFAFVDLWWQHHWGLGPFDFWAWLNTQWAGLGAEAVSAMLAIVILVGLAGRFRYWWAIAGAIFIAVAALFAFTSGWLSAAGTTRLTNPVLLADVQRLERAEHVTGTPVRVEDVSSWTDQANAFTTGFGPSTHVILWNTLLDGRFTRGEENVVIAHELGHVRSRHIIKAIGWSALVILPTLWLLSLALRSRGGLGRPENLPYAFLILAVIGLLAAPVQNFVSRRYEAEADWRALQATRDPASMARLFKSFQRTSLEEPNPGALDYLWLENHPTLMQRIAMAKAWRERR
jgi:Zn-dependent protease with chaperone function